MVKNTPTENAKAYEFPKNVSKIEFKVDPLSILLTK